jgi:hypothetical protein
LSAELQAPAEEPSLDSLAGDLSSELDTTSEAGEEGILPPSEPLEETGSGEKLSEVPAGEGLPDEAAEALAEVPADGLLGALPEGGEGEEPGVAVTPDGEEVAEEEEGEKKPGFFAWVAGASVYNMLLLIAVVALLLGSLGMYIELKRYNFDVKAEEGRRPLAAAPVSYDTPASTTEAA